MVDAARTLSVDHLKDVVTRWRHDHADDADDDRQELFLTPTLRGRGRLAGDLNAETTQVMITALRAIQDAEVRSNDRTDTRDLPSVARLLKTGRWWPGSVPTSSSPSTSRAWTDARTRRVSLVPQALGSPGRGYLTSERSPRRTR